MSAYDLVEEVKRNAGIESDNALALAIGKERGNVSAWKNNRAKPDGETVLKLISLGKVDPRRALELMQGGYASLLFMPVTAVSALAFTGAVYALKGCILC